MPLVLLLLLSAFVLSGQTRGPVGVRIILGLTDTAATPWDGSVEARNARITSIAPWRFDDGDAILGADSWRVSTHRIRLFGGGQNAPFVANGVVVWLADAVADAELAVMTKQGNFTVRLSDIPYGRLQHALNGRVMADRIPPVSAITNTADEQDYPAAVAKNGEVWLVYLKFRHNPNHDRIRANYVEAPRNFDEMKALTGGDQIVACRYSNEAWGPPLAITEPGGDLYRPAIAIDGSGRPWVFWSANEKGNFDLWARVIENGKPAAAIRLTNAPGADMDPVAATDSSGRVWLAWQGWREGKASIFAVSQNGNRFSKPVAVSFSAGNEWNPAIAADGSGRVAVAWDSYRHGNYDVFARLAEPSGDWGKEIPVAATPLYEAYPSIAFDAEGRLWSAYEEGAAGWGKDWGAYETAGVSLYQGRAIRVVALDRAGRVMETAADVGAALPGIPEQRVDKAGRQDDVTGWTEPRLSNFKDRPPSRVPAFLRGPKNSLPRLLVDASGRVWLAARSAHPIWWNPVGTVWSEYVVSYDGSAWTGPIFLDHSDNLLDNRPALASIKPGELLAIHSSDGRRQFQAIGPGNRGRVVRDPFQNDLYLNVVTLGPAAGPAAVKESGLRERPASVPAGREAETAAIARMRDLRLKSRYGTLRIARGEFHRHSEISMDGGNDGTILDQWRYIIDAAGMDWVGCCDHDNGGGREYSWWITQKETDLFYAPGRFSPMFSYERSVPYPEGHRNTIFVQRGVRPLPRLPKVENDSTGHAPDTQMFYRYLRQFHGIVASHTSGTNMGTDWRDNDPEAEPVVEIYQGDRQNYEMPGAPRSNTEADSIGGWRPKGFVNLALEMGYKLGFQASSDHVSTHMSYCNVLVPALNREAILAAFRQRHVYGATDNIVAEVTSGGYLMGDSFSSASQPELQVHLTGTAPFAKVHIVKDNRYVYSTEPRTAEVSFRWTDNAAQAGRTSHYYVRGEQEDGELVWASPLWITYTGK